MASFLFREHKYRPKTTSPGAKLDVRGYINSSNIWSTYYVVNSTSAERLTGPDGSNLDGFMGLISAGVAGTSGRPAVVYLASYDSNDDCYVIELGRTLSSSRLPIIFCETDNSLRLRIGHSSTYSVNVTFISN